MSTNVLFIYSPMLLLLRHVFVGHLVIFLSCLMLKWGACRDVRMPFRWDIRSLSLNLGFSNTYVFFRVRWFWKAVQIPLQCSRNQSVPAFAQWRRSTDGPYVKFAEGLVASESVSRHCVHHFGHILFRPMFTRTLGCVVPCCLNCCAPPRTVTPRH